MFLHSFVPLMPKQNEEKLIDDDGAHPPNYDTVYLISFLTTTTTTIKIKKVPHQTQPTQ